MRGMDPRRRLSLDMQLALIEHVNKRVEDAILAWTFPEWVTTEERAFRQVWRSDKQYLRNNPATRLPDEVFDIPTVTYYRVNKDALADPPVGTLPTDTTYFTPLDSAEVNRYIEYDQPGKRAIGTVLGIYASDPRMAYSNARGLCFMPSEFGIDVYNPPNPTVFVMYVRPKPIYTMQPQLVGRVYTRGTVVFDPASNECFRALLDTAQDVTDTNAWTRVPFLDAWYNYVRYGAYADSFGEVDPTLPINDKLILKQDADQKAMDALQSQIDALVNQGQRLRWNFRKRNRCWCESIVWSGGTVTTLTDIDEPDWIYPVTPEQPAVKWMYRPEIVSIDGTAPSLKTFPTRLYLAGSLIELVVTEADGTKESQRWQLEDGPASDDTDPGQLVPNDYEGTTNSKHWVRVQ